MSSYYLDVSKFIQHSLLWPITLISLVYYHNTEMNTQVHKSHFFSMRNFLATMLSQSTFIYKDIYIWKLHSAKTVWNVYECLYHYLLPTLCICVWLALKKKIYKTFYAICVSPSDIFSLNFAVLFSQYVLLITFSNLPNLRALNSIEYIKCLRIIFFLNLKCI